MTTEPLTANSFSLAKLISARQKAGGGIFGKHDKRNPFLHSTTKISDGASSRDGHDDPAARVHRRGCQARRQPHHHWQNGAHRKGGTRKKVEGTVLKNSLTILPCKNSGHYGHN